MLAESPSLEPAAQSAAFAILADAFTELGFEATRVRGRSAGDHLHAAPAGTDPSAAYQLLLGHMDTVWPSGTVKTRPPVRVYDDRIAGPGVRTT